MVNGSPFLLPPFFDYAATLLWAVTGAMIGARRGCDIVGMFVIAMVSSLGGGLLRDGLFLVTHPVLVRKPEYLMIALFATLCVWLFGPRIQRMTHLTRVTSLVDALGLGAYAVVGLDRALQAHFSEPGAILVGVVNAVGGGLLRDILTRQEPVLLKPGPLISIPAVLGCLLYLLMVPQLGFEPSAGAWTTIAVVFTIRVLSDRYEVRTTTVQWYVMDGLDENPRK